MQTILVVAGSDSFGGAGIQADIKTGASLDVHVTTAITAITAQNSTTVNAIYEVPAEFVVRQIETIIEDIVPMAVKIGMLYSASVITELENIIQRHHLENIVIDPVLQASTGRPLLQPEGIDALKRLFRLASVITPNIHEAMAITGHKIRSVDDMKQCARILKSMGPDVIITGGHMEKECTDILYDAKNYHKFSSPKIYTRHTHGTGCVFSTALAAFISKGHNILKAAELAHSFVRQAIKNSYECGHGSGPVRPGHPGHPCIIPRFS
ncbi:MAG: bifunctional hydroxymethylpyrimidine kinase/phosphomethylpyrimidine kinase [Deltaproteobacteria bacterium]|nr:bifunctional hydroxymethylpyrimidine kinase/phosphomethylpyrimidine kinase [Deltaproteobacteria bacterium]